MTPRKWATAAAIVGAALLFAWYSGPTWRVANVRVVNNAAIPGEQIIGVSALQGEHYQFVDLAAAAARVDDLPGVDAAQVTCRWWGSAECTIAVQPAQPLALWESAEGDVWTDYDGKVQRALGKLEARLRLRVESGTPPSLGADVDESLLRALREIVTLPAGPVKLSWSEEFGLMYESADGVLVRLGGAERTGAVREKMALAQSLAATLAGRGIRPRVIDVRQLEAPYYSQ
jgi:cell division septal protein FtsQ